MVQNYVQNLAAHLVRINVASREAREILKECTRGLSWNATPFMEGARRFTRRYASQGPMPISIVKHVLLSISLNGMWSGYTGVEGIDPLPSLTCIALLSPNQKNPCEEKKSISSGLMIYF